MRFTCRLQNTGYTFRSIKEVMAKAGEVKTGDTLAGIAAESLTERVAAKQVLASLSLHELRENPAVPYETDEVTQVIQDDLNEVIYAEHSAKSVGEFRQWLLSDTTSGQDILRASRGLTSEMIAAVTKLMSNLDLIVAAKKIEVRAHCNTTIGGSDTLAFRLQPNHTVDDLDGIRISLLEGLSYGVGDAVIGLNPVIDSAASVGAVLRLFDEVKNSLKIPTQTCVLAHMRTQMEAIRQGAPADLMFQSIAGSQKGNAAFGIDLALIREARDLMLHQGSGSGPNVLYFETGQGSELSSDSHYGWDQLTMEARCYGLARHFSPFLVNTVVGFIGPEYLYDARQVTRAGLEDHFMGKLSGLSMGVDACYTNHMDTDQNDIENLALLLANAGCNYLIAVPQGDDIMLNYQCPGYHDAQTLRAISGKRPISEFESWLERMGILEQGRLTEAAGDATYLLERMRRG